MGWKAGAAAALATLAFAPPLHAQVTRYESQPWGALYAAYGQALRQADPAKVAGDGPALDFARARLTYRTNPGEGVYRGWLAYYRMTWDGFHCSDPTAAQGVDIIVQDMRDADPGFLKGLDDPPLKLAAHRRLKADGAVFAAPSRPLWICSHGITGFVGGGVILPETDPSLARRRAQFDTLLAETIGELERGRAN